MDKTSNHIITGDIRFSNNKVKKDRKEIPKLLAQLQAWMNQNEVIKIDVSLNPFEEGSPGIAPRNQNIIISTQN